jgi:hypothetical protein
LPPSLGQNKPAEADGNFNDKFLRNARISRHSTKRRALLNLGCSHPVARVISYDVGFNPSMQRQYCRLLYYLYIHSYMFRSYDHHQVEKYITTLGLLKQRISYQLSSPKVVKFFQPDDGRTTETCSYCIYK